MIRTILAALACLIALPVWAEVIILASTTSTQNSGLYDAILPAFEAETGIEVRVVAVGTGQAIRIAKNGDADVLLVHHRPSEEAFVAEGWGTERRDVMYNDFVLIGPRDDPADIASQASILGALQAIAQTQALFISRGDESGTHRKEMALWQQADHVPMGLWYREIGAGMGAALNMASAEGAYVLSDRGTWLSFGNKGDLTILAQGDSALHNPYGIVLINPDRHPHINTEAAQRFADWITGPTGQQLIADFRVDGQQLFCPLAIPDDRTACPVEAY